MKRSTLLCFILSSGFVAWADDGGRNGKDIAVRPDPEVSPPVLPAKDIPAFAKILIRLADDGTVTGAAGLALATDEDVSKYMIRRRDEILQAGHQPRILLRGNQQVLLERARKIIRIASDAGISQILFSSRPDENDDAASKIDALNLERGLQSAPEPMHP